MPDHYGSIAHLTRDPKFDVPEKLPKRKRQQKISTHKLSSRVKEPLNRVGEAGAKVFTTVIGETPGEVATTAALGPAAKGVKLGVAAAKKAFAKGFGAKAIAPVGAIFSQIGKKRYPTEAANMTRVKWRSHKENLAKIDKASPKDRAEAITRTDVEDLDHLDKVGAESVKTPRSSARRKVAEVANALRAPGTKQHKQDTFKRDEFIKKISGGGKVTGKQLTGLAEDVHSDVIRDPGKVGTVTSAVDDFIKAAKVKKRKK